MKTYKVLQTTLYEDWIEVKAKNKEDALDKVDDGAWTDEDIITSKVAMIKTTGEVEEIK